MFWHLFASAFIAAALLVALASNALAARSYVSQLTEANGTAFTTPSGLAVDGSDNVWVSDIGSSLVSKFDSSGTYQAQNDGTGSWGTSKFIQDLAFGSGAGQIYVADSNFDDLWGLNLDASFNADVPSGLGGCCFIYAAVDNSGTATDGDIYVTNASSSLVPAAVTRIDASGAADNFSASASYISGNQLTGTPDQAFGTPTGVAVDASGNIYVVDQGNVQIYEFDSSGTFVKNISLSGTLTDIAVDPTNGNILVGDTGQGVVHEFNSSGTPLATIDGGATPAGSFTPQGLAIDSTGRLYVADSANAVVDIFSAAPPTHLLTVSKAGAGAGLVTSSPAGISCGATCSASFEEGSTVTLTAAPASGSTFTGWSGPGAGSCTGTGTCGVTVSADTSVTATFAPLAPTVTTTAGATGITQHAATVAGTVNPRSHTVTDCHIEYGTSTSYGSQVPCSPASPGGGIL